MPWNIQVDILSRLSTKDLHEVESVCKDWQCIIRSPRFYMLQINANPNQDAIIMAPINDPSKPMIQSLSSNDIYKFINPIVNSTSENKIVAVSNGLVLMKVNWQSIQFLVYNPITKKHVKLPQLLVPLFYSEIVCDFFEHDLQSSTYKIFVASYKEVHIYSSSSHFWLTFHDSFSNFTSNLQHEYWKPFSCIMYKSNIYVAYYTSKAEWMVAVYNPMNDVWNNLNMNIKTLNICHDEGRLIIANDRLFFAQVCYPRTITFKHKSISIFELNIEDRLFIPITIIIRPNDMQYNRYLPSHCIFGINNKITIVGYMKDIVITFDVSTNEEREIGYNYTRIRWYHGHIYPLKYTLVSPL